MPDDVMPLWQSWRRRLASEGKSPNTIALYRLALQSFSEWCVTDGRPTCPEKQSPDDVAEFMTYLLVERSAGTAGSSEDSDLPKRRKHSQALRDDDRERRPLMPRVPASVGGKRELDEVVDRERDENDNVHPVQEAHVVRGQLASLKIEEEQREAAYRQDDQRQVNPPPPCFETGRHVGVESRTTRKRRSRSDRPTRLEGRHSSGATRGRT